MNRSSFLRAIAGLLGTTLTWPLQAAPEAQANAGRALVKRYADAIVNVELVVTLRMKMGDREAPPRDQRIEVNGTIISPSGLTVTSLAAVDPQAMFDTLRAGAGGGMRVPEFVGSEFKEVKLRTADGKEVPARFVLKDADLDLAFMAPEATPENAARQFPYVKLEDVAQGSVLGDYFYVSRAPKIQQRTPLVRGAEIIGVVEKPRRFYIMTDQLAQWLGGPVFNSEGRVLGITLQHFANGQRSGLIVLPADDIAEMAKQASAVQSTPKAGG